MKFCTKYDHMSDQIAPLVFHGESLTRQEFADESNINTILAKYHQGSLVMANGNSAVGAYMDVSEVIDYQGMVDLTIAAQDAFMGLPSSVRKEFDHDPAAFLAAAQDETQRPVFERLGLLEMIEHPKVTTSPEGDAQTTT